MSRQVTNYRLKPGDRVVVPKSSFGLIKHHAIYLGQNNSEQDLFIENKIGFGVRLVSAVDFFNQAKKITKIERLIGNNAERKGAVEKALSKLGLPYDLINYNCQHFANEVQ
jgi:uncharacterized protein YycO